jgi:hypothetical protein
MAWKIEKGIDGKPELVISGFENGVASSPYEGIGDMRNMDIITAPKQASVMFGTTAVTLPPSGYTGVAFSVDAGTDVVTTASTTGFYVGMAVTIVTISGADSFIAGRTYYVGDITPTTFKLYVSPRLLSVFDTTTNRTGTFTVHTFGTPVDSVSTPLSALGASFGSTTKASLILTSDAFVWFLSPGISSVPANTLQFLGNIGHSTVSGTITRGIVIWKGYIFIFCDESIDYVLAQVLSSPSQNPSALWVYGWQTTLHSSFYGHRALAATDSALYFCNDGSVGSLLENAGESFSPTDTDTYTFNIDALVLPPEESATCLAQLGVNLLIGGLNNFIYPWDRVSTSFSYPLVVAESFISCIVSTNSNAYIFAGQRGRIYITNGSNVDLFKKFPDSLSAIVEPYYKWDWAIYYKNQLYFSLYCTDNSSVAIENFAGLWAIDLNNDALRLSNSLSFGTYTGRVRTLLPMGQPYPTGDGIYAAWVSGATTGIDYGSATPYINYEARIDTDIIPVGTFLFPNTFSNVEFKLAKPLVSGESVKLSQRKNLTSSFAEIGTTSYSATTDTLSYAHPVNFELSQWLQIRAETSSTATTPSYCPLLEIRLRP